MAVKKVGLGNKGNRVGGRVFCCQHCEREFYPPNLTRAQAAHILNVSISTVNRLIDEGDLLQVTVRQGCKRIARASIIEYMNAVTEAQLKKDYKGDPKSVSTQLMLFQWT